MPSHRVFIADSRSMPELADSSVHMVVTSPPYWCIKDYAHPGQIGFDQSYEQYLADLGRVVAECHRVLHPGCRAAINIGDQYLRASEHERYRVQPIPADIMRTAGQVGFDFMGNIIWEKLSTTKTTGGGVWMGSTYWPRDGHFTYEHEYIILLRKQGRAPRPTPEQKAASKLTKEQRTNWFRGAWRIPPQRQQGHVAMFPLEVPQRLIKMYSFRGETVLDPFLGSGTTALAAQLEGRASVGYEINPKFEVLIREKLQSSGDLFTAPAHVTFERRPQR